MLFSSLVSLTSGKQLAGGQSKGSWLYPSCWHITAVLFSVTAVLGLVSNSAVKPWENMPGDKELLKCVVQV